MACEKLAECEDIIKALKKELKKQQAKAMKAVMRLQRENAQLVGRFNDILSCGVLRPKCTGCAKKNQFARAALKGE